MSDKRLIFLIDMDGFIADLHRKVARELRRRLGSSVTVIECTNNSPAKGFAHLHPEASKMVKEMLAWNGFYRDLSLIEGAQEAIQRMVDMNIRPMILSSLGDAPGCAPDKAAWLKEHFGSLIHPRDYCFTSNKELVRGDFFGDDGAEYLRTWKHRNPEGVTFTLARPYTSQKDADIFALDWHGLTASLAGILRSRKSA